MSAASMAAGDSVLTATPFGAASCCNLLTAPAHPSVLGVQKPLAVYGGRVLAALAEPAWATAKPLPLKVPEGGDSATY